MKTRFSLLIIGLIMSFSVLSCKKKHDDIYGTVTVHGIVTDEVSGAPIPNAAVQLVKIERKYTGFGYAAVETDVAAMTTTNNNGRYSFSYEAKGVYEFTLHAMPTDPLHVPSNVDVATDAEHIKTAGEHEQNLRCYRSAWVKIALIDNAPFDTPYAISFSVNSLPSADDIVLNNFSGDTTVYLKLVGNLDYTNNIRFSVSEHGSNTYKRIARPWDTLTMQCFY